MKLLEQDPQVHRFDALKYLAPDKSHEEVLEALHEHARLVQGLWVAKSPLVYETVIDVSASDYVLLLFSKNVVINMSEIPGRMHECLWNVKFGYWLDVSLQSLLHFYFARRNFICCYFW